MLSSWLLLSCARNTPPTPEVEAAAEPAAETMSAPLPEVAAPTAAPKPEGLCGEGSASLTPPLEQLWAGVLSGAAEERILVVVSLAEGAATPALLEEPLAAGSLVQGWISTAKLCELASAEGVEAVRDPIEARPK